MTPDEIRKCSDDELSRVIAESLELKPAYEFVAARTIENAAAMMRLKFWRPEFFDYYDAFGHNKYRPVPRDFVNDPAMSMMLLEKLVRREGNTVALSRWLNINDTFVVRECDDDEGVMTGRTYAAAPTIGRALAECYAQSIQKEQVL